MTAYYEDDQATLLLGDSLEVLRTLPRVLLRRRRGVMSAFLLWPLAALHLTPRILARLHTALAKDHP